MTRDELLGLPSTIDVPTAARALGIGSNKAYELIRAGKFPVRPLVLGRQIRIPSEALRIALGYEPIDRAAAMPRTGLGTLLRQPGTGDEGNQR
jgi:excisionase family DNA binding protein